MVVLHHDVTNPNATWVNSNGFMLFYIVAVAATHLVLLSIPVLSTEQAWTLTNVVHAVVCYRCQGRRQEATRRKRKDKA